jgi:hypothetical protein
MVLVTGFDVSTLVVCPHCGAEYDASRNLSARRTARLRREPLRLTCGGCGTVFTCAPDPAGEARLAAARRARTVVAIAGGVVAVLVIAVLAFPPRGDDAPGPGSPPTGRNGAAEKPPTPPGQPVIPDDPPPPADPALAWNRQARDLTRSLPAEFETGFAFRAKHPLLIAVEKAPHFAVEVLLEDYDEHLGQLHAALRSDFKDVFDLKSSGRVLPVVVLGSREAYDRYAKRTRGEAMPKTVSGHYEYARRRLILYVGPRGEQQVLFHEGTHQVVHHFAQTARGPEAFWFLEGLACYYEAFGRDDQGGIVFHVVNRNRLPAAAEAFERGEAMPLEAFLGMTAEDFWRRMRDPALEGGDRDRLARRLYAEAWALWHFLLNTTPERKRAAADYVRAELKGVGGIEAFEAAFGALPALQRDLRGHVLRLKAEDEKER